MSRGGSCTEGCGACCTFVTLNVNPLYLEEDNKNWLRLHGIRLEERDGAVWAYLPIPCQSLQPDKTCGLYGKPERPRLCDDWPFNQKEIITLHEVTGVDCGYSFTKGIAQDG